MNKRYVVRLTKDERGHLEGLLRRRKAHTRKLLYARILLKADAAEGAPAWADERIAAEAFTVPARPRGSPRASALLGGGARGRTDAQEAGQRPQAGAS